MSIPVQPHPNHNTNVVIPSHVRGRTIKSRKTYDTTQTYIKRNALIIDKIYDDCRLTLSNSWLSRAPEDILGHVRVQGVSRVKV
jgi:hypothetical protein